MRFDVTKGDRGTVYDANGVLIPGAVRGDTESGLVQSAVLDEKGVAVMEPDGNCKYTIQRHPAPLYIKPPVFPRHREKSVHEATMISHAFVDGHLIETGSKQVWLVTEEEMGGDVEIDKEHLNAEMGKAVYGPSPLLFVWQQKFERRQQLLRDNLLNQISKSVEKYVLDPTRSSTNPGTLARSDGQGSTPGVSPVGDRESSRPQPRQ